MTVSLHAIDGGAISHESQRFDGPASARALAEVEPYATGGAQLYIFLDGHYQPGERHLAPSASSSFSGPTGTAAAPKR
jgi:hypothetical protein